MDDDSGVNPARLESPLTAERKSQENLLQRKRFLEDMSAVILLRQHSQTEVIQSR